MSEKVITVQCQGCDRPFNVRLPYEDAANAFYQGRSREKMKCPYCKREDYVVPPERN